ncbi:Ser/Thr protein phosphatase [Colletotrichum eremochloae]|nr:Ser/Thr protein phosphatase [Colletotrichum eremochloae]
MASIQIMSDLHLSHQEYKTYRIKPDAPYLALLGDIGCVKDASYIDFLERQLTAFRIVFHVLGNHEPYGSSWDDTIEKLQSFQDINQRKREQDPSAGLGEYVFMYQREYTLPDTDITILGCTLFSNVPDSKLTAVSNGLNDFYAIDDWTVEEHCQRHNEDLAWLNARVKATEQDPRRAIVILTHHSPTNDSRAVDPLHVNSNIQSGFSTDLRGQLCWENSQVKLWAFGHTHYNCDFVDEETGKRVYTNQKGYSAGPSAGFRAGDVAQIG